MNDEMNQAPELAVPDPAAPEEPSLAPSSEAEPQPEPAAPIMEVVSVDELVDRLIQGEGEPAESAEPVPDDLEPVELLEDIPVVPDPAALVLEQLLGELVGVGGDLDTIEEHMDTIQQTLNHPALTTSFADYTVTEALLLLLLLFAFVSACARMLRGGFSWLKS